MGLFKSKFPIIMDLPLVISIRYWTEPTPSFLAATDPSTGPRKVRVPNLETTCSSRWWTMLVGSRMIENDDLWIFHLSYFGEKWLFSIAMRLDSTRFVWCDTNFCSLSIFSSRKMSQHDVLCCSSLNHKHANAQTMSARANGSSSYFWSVSVSQLLSLAPQTSS